MNCCGSIITEQDIENKRLNEQIKKERRKEEVKLLLLGAGESGKSTIAKQIRLINQDGFNDEERVYYKNIIHANAFTCLKTILTEGAKLNISIQKKKLEPLAGKFVDGSYEWEGKLNGSIAKDMGKLWKDSGVKEMYKKRAEYQLPDCAEYYLNDIKRISEEGYVPTDEDIIRSRIKTTGVIETKFEIEGVKFNLLDVGGQRSERRKWVMCFGDVASALFCIALSEYNLKCIEDNITNRMLESIKLFSEIVNSKWFARVPLILFLNKSDLLQERVDQGISIKIAFPEYDGEDEFNAYVDYIYSKFKDVIKNQSKPIYQHVTNATSKDNIKFVWSSVQNIVLEKALDSSGLNL